MKKMLMLIPAAAMLASITPVKAEAMNLCIDRCNAEFPGSDPIAVAERGWCYLIRNCTFDQT